MKLFAVALILMFLPFYSLLQVPVNGYFKKNGTYVAPHYRSAPNGSKMDNWSTKGNYNPYTGKAGTKNVYPEYNHPLSFYATNFLLYDIDFATMPVRGSSYAITSPYYPHNVIGYVIYNHGSSYTIKDTSNLPIGFINLKNNGRYTVYDVFGNEIRSDNSQSENNFIAVQTALLLIPCITLLLMILMVR